jgi:hypothetical protein
LMTPITSVRFPNWIERDPRLHSNTGRIGVILSQTALGT